jgi:hypothetical protein
MGSSDLAGAPWLGKEKYRIEHALAYVYARVSVGREGIGMTANLSRDSEMSTWDCAAEKQYECSTTS